MEYRIEQLARKAAVAVDTIRFYQGSGLLPAPRHEGRVTWYSEGHLERLLRIRALQQRGFTLTVIRRFLDGELESSDEALVAAVTTPAAADGETMSLEELAARSGLAAPVLGALQQADLLVSVGAPGPNGEPRFQASDLQALAAGMKLLEAGIPLTDLLQLAGQHAEATDRTARRAVELFDRHVRERLQAGGDSDVSEMLLQRFNELLDASATLVQHHFQRTLMRAAEEHIERQRENLPASVGP